MILQLFKQFKNRKIYRIYKNEYMYYTYVVIYSRIF